MEIEEINEKSLKFLSYNHLIKDLIENSVKDCSENNLLTLLIVDNYTSKILSSFMKMTDLLNKGISSIELLNNKRNKLENYGAIYFISPNVESCNLLIQDFIDIDSPLYNRIYLFFSHKLNEDLLEIITTEGIIQHTICIKEFNLSFFIFDKNIFNLKWNSGLKIFNCNNEIELKLLESLSYKIFTVCSTLNICPYIQYQKNSKICEKLSDKLDYIFNNNEIINNKKKEGIILLTDRTFDPVSPLLHDYNYRSICYDLLDIKNKKININEKIIELSDNDEFWNNFKLMHIAEVFEELFNNFEIYENNELNKDNKNLTFLEMANYLENKNKYQIKIQQLINQLLLADKINEKYKTKNIYELIELEQDIISGQLNNNEILFKLSDINQTKKIDKEDYLRLLLLLYLNKKDIIFNEILNNDLFKKENILIDNLKFITNNYIYKDICTSLNNSQIKIKIKNENISNIIKYDNLRIEPLISTLVYKASNLLLEENLFPFKNFKKEEIKKHFTDKNPLIIFNIGGLSYNEISSIENLEKLKNFNHKIYIGTTCIMNSCEYINQLKNISKDYEKEIRIDINEDYDIKEDENACVLDVNTNNNNESNEDLPSEKVKLLYDNNDDLINI